MERFNWRIYGPGGAYQGEYEDGRPAFGGRNLIYAPTWWGKTVQEAQGILEMMRGVYPGVQMRLERIGVCNEIH